MQEQTLQQALRERALGFHRALHGGRVYRTPLTEQQFLDRAENTLVESASDVMQGRQDRELAILGLPLALIGSLSDIVPTAWWDYEFGYQHLFTELDKMFGQTPLRFEWTYDQDAKSITYALDAQAWTLDGVELDDEVELQFVEIYTNLDRYLQQHNLRLYDAVSGDQTTLTLVVPTGAAEPLRDYLIASDDPRAASFYE